MATHYELLGVEADASREQIKRAYLRRALQHHPDRQGDVEDAVRDGAASQMRELNAAWGVLGDSVSRDAYDRELRGEARGRERSAGRQGVREPVRCREPQQARRPESAAGHVGRPGPPPDPVATGTSVLEDTADADRRGFWVGVSVIVVILTMAVGALVFTAYANDRHGDDFAVRGIHQSDGMGDESVDGVHRVPLETGSCVVLASLEGRIRPMAADCSIQGAYEVTQIQELGRPCPSGETPFDLQAEMRRLCLTSP